jgi:hypothetical protein
MIMKLDLLSEHYQKCMSGSFHHSLNVLQCPMMNVWYKTVKKKKKKPIIEDTWSVKNRVFFSFLILVSRLGVKVKCIKDLTASEVHNFIELSCDKSLMPSFIQHNISNVLLYANKSALNWYPVCWTT